jgi:raffinose/stachyose/melibiose transport system permease protein
MNSNAAANTSKRSRTWLLIAVSYIFAVIYFAPVILALINSFKSKGEIIQSAIALPKIWTLANYRIVLTESNFLKALSGSLFLTVSATVLIILIAAPAGYSLARWNKKTADIILFIFMISLFLPFEVYMISLVQTVYQMGIIGSLPGLVVVYVGLGVPVPIFLFRGFVKSIPYELEEAAVIDGCSKWRLFAQIIMPLLAPVSATVAILNVLWIWNDFLLPLLVLSKPLTIPLSQTYFFGEYNQEWHYIMAGFIVTTIPAVIFFLIMQKSIVKGLVAGALKS